MSGVNRVTLVGRLGKDPESKQTRQGKEFCSFSMATSKKIGEEEKTQWHSVVVWSEHTAKYLVDFAIKGTMVYVEGEIEYRKYQKQDGSDGYATDIIVGQYNGTAQILFDGKGRGGNEAATTRPSARTKTAPSPKKEDTTYAEDLDDEIPF